MGDWDAIVFSEVLSYLAVHEAIAEVSCYSKALSPEGKSRHQHVERRKKPSDLARVAPRVSWISTASLATKGAVALLPDQRKPRAQLTSRRALRALRRPGLKVLAISVRGAGPNMSDAHLQIHGVVPLGP